MKMRIAVLLTVFNRVDMTISCLESLFAARLPNEDNFSFKVFLTDDGSSDGTAEKILKKFPHYDIKILIGDGSLYWNAGMNNSWTNAIKEGGYDGYLWLNNDSVLYPNIWEEVLAATCYSINNYGRGGIYIGSTFDAKRNSLSYGGFVFTNYVTLKDRMLTPDGTFQLCHAGHGNITFVAHDVVLDLGVFCAKYLHGGGDHDYTYLAHKKGIPVMIMREYVGECENDHQKDIDLIIDLSLKERLSYVKTPLGYNLGNALLFQKRCFPYRYPFVLLLSYFRVLFPKTYLSVYYFLRGQK